MLVISRPLTTLLAVLVASAALLVAPVAPSGATVPGGNGRIAFASDIDGDYEIYTMRSDGLDIRQLTFNSARDYNPSWSPDGGWIAFDSDRGGTSGEIFVMRASGDGQHRLTTSPGQDLEPAWSPDGGTIAFTSDRGSTGDFDIFTLPLDGGKQRRITRNSIVDRNPAWSPDGRALAFEREQGSTDHIWVMRPDGRRVRQVTPDGIFASYQPAWSPNGRWLAFQMDDGVASGYELWKSKLDGSALTNLSNTGAGVHEEEPSWSPRGDKIVFVDNFDGDREIVVTGSSVSAPVQLTYNSADDRVPDWQPR